MMNTTSTVNTASAVIRETREELKLSLRDFAQELAVSHNAIALWENGQSDIDAERIKGWLTDPRLWVRIMGVKVFTIKFGPSLAASSESPKAA